MGLPETGKVSPEKRQSLPRLQNSLLDSCKRLQENLRHVTQITSFHLGLVPCSALHFLFTSPIYVEPSFFHHDTPSTLFGPECAY